MSAYLREDGVDVNQQRTAWQELNDLNSQYGELVADGGLAAASFAPPPWGTAADVVSIGKSLWSGNWGDALFDTIGIVPLFGDGIKAGRLVNKANDLRRALDVGGQAMRASLRKTKDAAGRYWDDIVRSSRGRYDEAIEACGGSRRCMDKKASLKGPQYRNTPREFDDDGNRLGEWLDSDGNPAERGDGIWHPNGATGDPVEYKNGFPDFSSPSHSAGSVEIPMRGNHSSTNGTGDYAVAEDAWRQQHGDMPDGYDDGDFIWHHKEDGVTMELVRSEVHTANRHAGGASLHAGSQSDNF
ncbi:HNH endonuclease [Loktanella sp. F6476L]|uniref:HNH endonuclease n=1 Tax=Loktanella sp. F6476L TaxID=2926405 RepID=UPI001FF2649A|nr:HNH endonuclease [Loktanella sp. F6476L]MCK0122695.1 HNH endonuclease [Loktanella sp. F6476L]